jgi:hypothetical protein
LKPVGEIISADLEEGGFDDGVGAADKSARGKHLIRFLKIIDIHADDHGIQRLYGDARDIDTMAAGVPHGDVVDIPAVELNML